MLRALGSTIKRIASLGPRDSISPVRRLTRPREALAPGKPLRALVRSLPAISTQLQAWFEHDDVSKRDVRLQKFALSYLSADLGALRPGSSELFRYFEDAYLLARVYMAQLGTKTASGRELRAADWELSQSLPELISLARRLLPEETKRVDDLIVVLQEESERLARADRRAVDQRDAADDLEYVDLGGDG